MLRPVMPPRTILSRSIAFALGLAASAPASANPQGMDVVSGTVSTAMPNPQTLEITNSPGAILNWQGFDIGAGETTRFIQQDAASAVLNRVTTQNSSEIFGQLVSNGRVFLINPAGILIGRDATVDTAGLVMSTLNISDADFAAGRFRFQGGAESGTITNHGYIKSAPNGEIILIAPKIVNAPLEGNPQSGLIESENGELVLAAGHAMTISSLDDPDVSFEVQAPTDEVVNIGQLLARGGTASVLAGTIRHSGEINADALSVDETGKVVLTASHRIETSADSVISARGEAQIAAPNGHGTTIAAAGAHGGEVSIRANATANDATSQTPTSVQLAGRVDTSGAVGGDIKVEGDLTTVSGALEASGTAGGGNVAVLGERVTLASATITANAKTGPGGEIRVGGDLRGAETMRAAQTTSVDDASRLQANAGSSGKGGTIIVWSDQETHFKGAAAARGGQTAGDGGLVEVSGKEILRFAGGVDVGAPRGMSGTLLLDPRRIFIVPGGATVSVSDPTAAIGDQLGGSLSSLEVLANGNVLVINEGADVGGFTDAGKIILFDNRGNTLGSVSGNAANERLGSNSFFFAPGGNRLFLSPNASAGGLANAGAVILFDMIAGREIGRTSGSSANEFFGQSIDTLGSNFIIGSSLADIAGADSGSVVTVSGITGLELGRISGTAAGDLFGSTVIVNSTTNTFRIQASTADIGGNANAGAVVVGSGATGLELGRITGTTAGDQIGSSVVDNFALNTFRIDAPFAGASDTGAVITGSMVTGAELGRISGVALNDQFGANVSTSFAAPNTFRIVATGADISGITDAGAVIIGSAATGLELGRTTGQSTSEFYGSNLSFDVFGDAPTGRLIVRSSSADLGGTGNGFDDAGTVVLIDKATGAEIGRTNGLLAGDLLGSFDPIMRGSGNYFLQVPNANSNRGSLVLVSGTTGTRIGSVDGNAINESLGTNVDQITLGGSNVLLISDRHTNTAGDLDAGAVFVVADIDLGSGNIVHGVTEGVSATERFGQNGIEAFAPGGMLFVSQNADTATFTDNGSVVLVDFLGNEVGRVDGTSNNETLGVDGIIMASNGNFWVPSRLWDPIPSSPNRGSVVLGSGSTGLEIGRFDGNTNNEQLGSVLRPGELTNGDLLVISIGTNSHNSGSGTIAQLAAVDLGSGTIKRGSVDGTGPLGLAGSTLETALFDNLGLPDHYAVRAPSNNFNSEGAVFFVDGLTGAVIRQIDGLTSETLGSRPLVVLPGGNLGIPSPQANSGDGRILFVDPFNSYVDAGTPLLGLAGQGEGLGDANTIFNLSSLSSLAGGLFLIHSPDRTVSGKTNAGAVILMSGISGNVSLLGAFSGLETGDQLGSNGASDIRVLTSASNAGKFVIFNDVADDPTGPVGGTDDEGAVILANITGAELGRFYGQSANEGLGGSGTILERPNGNYFVSSIFAGPNNEGSLYLLSGVNGGLIGQVDGTVTNEFFGDDIFPLFSGDLLVGSTASDVGGFANGGTVVQVADVDLGSGNIVRGRINGGSIGEQLNVFNAQLAPDGLHYFVTSLNADPGGATNAGSVYFVNIGTGALTNRLDGLSAGDQFGTGISFSTNGNLIFNNFNADVAGATDAGRYVVASSAGALVGELRGNTANERLGLTQDFVGSERWLIAPLHNAGAGAIFAVGDQDLGGGNLVKASLLGATAGDGLGTFGASFFFGRMANDTRFVRAPNADVNGIVDAGSLLLVNSQLQIIGRTDGTSANERYGADNFVFLSNNGLAFESPDADVGSFVDAGAILQIDPRTGLEIQRVVGISANERLGAFGSQTLSGGKTAFFSPLADVNGVVDAGRIVFFDPTTGNVGEAAISVPFSNTPSGDFVVTTGALELALNAGANLILQANEDIFIDKDVILSASGGSLTLQAGRSIFVKGLLNMPNTNLRLVANESEANGVEIAFRGTGTGEFILEDPQVVGRTIELSAQAVRLFGGSDPASLNVLQTSSELFANFLDNGILDAPVTFVLGIEKLAVTADEIQIVGGGSPGAFAALASMGEFTVDAGNIVLEPGTAPGAHALFLGLGGLGEFSFKTCTGCGDTLLFTDPFLEDGPVSGLFIAGLFQDPAVNAILAMLGRDSDGDDEDDDDDEDVKECGI